MPRRLLLATLMLAALPAHAQQGEPLRLTCRADAPALLAQPLSFSIDLAVRQAVEAGSGEKFGVTVYRDGLGLWEAASGPGQIVYRIDRLSGRFARVDKQIRVDGACEKAAPKL